MLGLLLAAGCGLSEYESKMAGEQERLRYVDEENKYLEGPLDLPEKEEGEKDAKTVPASEVFVRPPKGIALKPDKLRVGVVYRYRATVNNPAFSDVYLAVTKEPSATFQQDVLRSLNGSGAAKSSKEIKRLGREPHRFEMYRDPLTGLNFFFYRLDAYQVALVYRISDAPNTAQALEYSLASLAVGPPALLQRRAWDKRTAAPGSSNRGGR